MNAPFSFVGFKILSVESIKPDGNLSPHLYRSQLTPVKIFPFSTGILRY